MICIGSVHQERKDSNFSVVPSYRRRETDLDVDKSGVVDDVLEFILLPRSTTLTRIFDFQLFLFL